MPSIARVRIAIFALSLRSAGGRLSPDMSNTPWILCSVTRKPKVFMAMLAKSPFDVVGVSRCLCSSSHFAMSNICFAVSRLTLFPVEVFAVSGAKLGPGMGTLVVMSLPQELQQTVLRFPFQTAEDLVCERAAQVRAGGICDKRLDFLIPRRVGLVLGHVELHDDPAQLVFRVRRDLHFRIDAHYRSSLVLASRLHEHEVPR